MVCGRLCGCFAAVVRKFIAANLPSLLDRQRWTQRHDIAMQCRDISVVPAAMSVYPDVLAQSSASPLSSILVSWIS